MAKQKSPINYSVLRRDYLIINMAAGVGLALLLGYLLLQNAGILPSGPCIFHDVIHLYCPGCGGTRAVLELLHGNFVISLWCNPAVLLGGLLIAYYELGVFYTLIRKNGKRYYIASGWPVYLYVIAIFVFAILRNILLLGFQIDVLHDFIK